MRKQKGIIHTVRRIVLGIRLDFFQGKQPLLPQEIQINQVRVPRKRGKGLIGAVSKAGRPNGKHLPIGLAGVVQEIDKGIRRFPQRADPIRGREAADCQQYPGFPRVFCGEAERSILYGRFGKNMHTLPPFLVKMNYIFVDIITKFYQFVNKPPPVPHKSPSAPGFPGVPAIFREASFPSPLLQSPQKHGIMRDRNCTDEEK